MVNILDVLQAGETDILKLTGPPKVDTVPKQKCIGPFPVTTGPSGLLEIRLRTLGEIIMGNEPDIGLVNPHAESIGADHDGDVPLLPFCLAFRPGLLSQSGMVVCCTDSLRLQERGYLLAFASVPGIDNAAAGNTLADV